MEPVDIEGMVRVIVKEARPARVFLFGSRATGLETESSDVDFLIIDKDSFGPHRSRRKQLARLWKALQIFPISKDLLLYSEEEVQAWRNSKNHIISRALREGKAVYGGP